MPYFWWTNLTYPKKFEEISNFYNYLCRYWEDAQKYLLPFAYYNTYFVFWGGQIECDFSIFRIIKVMYVNY